MIVAELLSDLGALLVRRMVNEGYKVDPQTAADPETAINVYLGLLRRVVDPRPRMILYAREFTRSTQFAPGLQLLESRVIAGEPVVGNQHRQLMRRPEGEDMLFNAFGIHHFHLGATTEPDGFVTRTSDVLLARVTDESMYFIEVVPHPRGAEGWAQCRALNLVHSNWPESLSDFVARGSHASGAPTTDDLVGALRGKHANHLFETTDGTVYRPPGGGYMASGLSLDIALITDHWLRSVRRAQQNIELAEAQIREAAHRIGVELDDEVRVALCDIVDGNLIGFVEGRAIRLELGSLS